MLRDFSIGYGDKEMYWIAATIANEPFQFEPHLSGALGDCGAIVHFDPTTVTSDALEAKPFYCNAEYLVDLAKIKVPGDFLSLETGSPSDAVITRPVHIVEENVKVYSLSPWKNQKHGNILSGLHCWLDVQLLIGFYPCSSCQHAQCIAAPKYIIGEIVERQRLILSLKASTDANKALDIKAYNTVRLRFAGYFASPLVI
jgi:hypothetical protein